MRVSNVLYEDGEPVGEDRARAMAVNEVLREPLSELLDDRLRQRRWCLATAVAGLLLGALALRVNAGNRVALALAVGGPLLGAVRYAYFVHRSPVVTVTGLEKGYWTGHCIPDEQGVVVYDAVTSLDPTAFELERLSDWDTVSTAAERLAGLDEFPVVMQRRDNIEATFTGALEDVRAEIEDAEQQTVEAPVVSAERPEADAIEFFAGSADEEPVRVDVDVPAHDAVEDVATLAYLERVAADEGGDAELESVSRAGRDLLDDLTGMQETAVELLNDHVATVADAVGLVSYHFYCPDCQTDDVESRVSLSDPVAGDWYCDACRSTHQTASVVPRHRIKDDVVNPTWDLLWAEKDDQRREIYENIEDQKQELQEREFEQRREEIRTATDRIRDLRSKIRDLETQAKAAGGTVDEIGDLMVKYDHLPQQRKQQFEQEVADSFAEIEALTERILAETRDEEDQRIRRAERAAEEKARLVREERRRRQVTRHVAEQRLEDGDGLDAGRDRERRPRGAPQRTTFSELVGRFREQKERLTAASTTDGGGR